MKEVTVHVDGTPVAKGRPRVFFNKSTGRSQTITPEKTAAYEAMCRRAAAEAMCGATPYTDPVSVDILAVMPIAESWSKSKIAMAVSGELRPTGVPDIDNIAKAALDALSPDVIKNDSQVVECSARKVYGLEPALTITVRTLQ